MLGVLRILAAMLLLVTAAAAEQVLPELIDQFDLTDVAPNADRIGDIREDGLAPVYKSEQQTGWIFITSDFVPTTGYSGKPIHIAKGISNEGVITGAALVKHSEPIVLVGIPEQDIKDVIAHYTGLDLRSLDQTRDASELEIVSGATVTIMVIDDSIIRAGLRAARAAGIAGFAVAERPTRAINRDAGEITDWEPLAGIGAIRRLTLDVATINSDFAGFGDPRTDKHIEAGPNEEAYVDVWAALVSQPSIGRSLLGEDMYANLQGMMSEGDEAIAIFGAGRWSFKGSGYVRGGIFDRFQLIQGEMSYRFRDRNNRRLVQVAAEGAPAFTVRPPATMLFVRPGQRNWPTSGLCVTCRSFRGELGT